MRQWACPQRRHRQEPVFQPQYPPDSTDCVCVLLVTEGEEEANLPLHGRGQPQEDLGRGHQHRRLLVVKLLGDMWKKVEI